MSTFQERNLHIFLLLYSLNVICRALHLYVQIVFAKQTLTDLFVDQMEIINPDECACGAVVKMHVG